MSYYVYDIRDNNIVLVTSIIMGRKKTQNEFNNEVTKLVGNEYTFIENYINSSTKIQVRHNKCNNVYKVTPNGFLNGNRCPYCVDYSSKYKGKSWEQILDIIGKFSVVDKYVDSSTPINVKCEVCNRTFMIKPENIKRYKSCPLCAKENADKRETISQEQWDSWVIEHTGNEFLFLESYKGTHIPIKVVHNTCGRIFKVAPHEFKAGGRCRICTRTKQQEVFEKEVSDMTFNEYVVASKYVRDNAPIKIKHLVCGNTYETTPNRFLNGNRCTYCNMSVGESLVCSVLKHLEIPFSTQIRFNNLKDKLPLSYDFYLPNENILIEYQGIQHYQPVDVFGGISKYYKQLEHDNAKRNYAKHNGYNLLEIPYTKNTEYKVKECVLSYIDSCRKAENPNKD